MGCCVSKCRPKKCCLEDDFGHHVQDKLVISKTLTLTPNKISPFPLSPTTSNTSSANSLLTSRERDRSFSNEFLWACVKENPHIIRINSIKEASLALSTTKSPSQRLQSPVKPLQRDHNRGRSTSPSNFTPSTRTLNSTSHYLPTRTRNLSLRSPSPSRRFNGGDNSNSAGILAATTCTSSSNRIVAPNINSLNSVSSSPSPSLRKDHNFRPPTPLNPCLRNRETFVHRITSKIDERALRAAMSTHQGNDSFTVEDINNPLISLDCFIFL